MYRPSYEMAGLTPTALAFDPFLSVSMISVFRFRQLWKAGLTKTWVPRWCRSARGCSQPT
jgi:hypothetical protein